MCGVFPRRGDLCVEVGVGRRGWIPELLDWGLEAGDLSGIDVDRQPIEMARRCFPGSDLRVGDGSALPWDDQSFRLVILSTVMSSILCDRVREKVASEAVRVLMPGGAVMYYDFRFNNPSNPNVRGIKKSEIARLFPSLERHLKLITLAPPVGRAVAPLSWTMATCLEAIPLLRSHYLGVLVKHA
jgi:ubiquinone/menaquinone biosynthesis C-methylase UbiE